MTEEQVFIRKASGLTRVVSPLQALMYSIATPGPHYILPSIVWMFILYPGVNLLYSMLFPLVLLPPMVVYYLFSVSMPRSGGEYIYVTRALNPALGFFTSWTITVTSLSWGAIAMSMYAVQQILATAFINQGLLTGSTDLINTGTYLTGANATVFVISIFFCAFSLFLMWRGTKIIMLLSEIAVCAAFILAAVLFIAFLQTTPQIFTSRLQSLSGIDYNQLLSQAKTAGWQPGWNFTATAMAGLTYVNFCILGNTYAANIAGEIKQVRRSSFYAMFGSLFFFIAYYFVIAYPASVIPGTDFWGAIGTLAASGTSPFPVFPFPIQLIVYMTDNAALVHLAWITYLIATFGAGTGLMFAPIRNMFAWSFDRIIPTSFAKVDRRGSPYAATILVGVIVLVLVYLTIFTPMMTYNSYSIGLWFTGWTVLGIAALVFPYVRKDIFEKSPDVVRKKVLGIPVISIMGLLTTIISLWTVYAIILPGFALSQLQYLAGSVVISAVLSFVIFGVSYFYNKSRGAPVAQQFKEIPPD